MVGLLAPFVLFFLLFGRGSLALRGWRVFLFRPEVTRKGKGYETLTCPPLSQGERRGTMRLAIMLVASRPTVARDAMWGGTGACGGAPPGRASVPAGTQGDYRQPVSLVCEPMGMPLPKARA